MAASFPGSIASFNSPTGTTPRLGHGALHASEEAEIVAIETYLKTAGSFSPPKCTTTVKNALTPSDGLVVYDITLHKLSVYSTGTSTWQTVTSS